MKNEKKTRLYNYGISKLKKIQINSNVLIACNLKPNAYLVMRLLMDYVPKATISYILNITNAGVSKIEKKLLDRNLLEKNIVDLGITNHSKKTTVYKYGNQYHYLIDKNL